MPGWICWGRGVRGMGLDSGFGSGHGVEIWEGRSSSSI